jgi:hypothetical protein
MAAFFLDLRRYWVAAIYQFCRKHYFNGVLRNDDVCQISTGVCMTKPDRKAITAKFAEVAQKTGGVFVFATRDANLPRGENVSAEIAEYPFAEHTCKECATVFSAVKAEGLHTQCVACSSDKVVAGKECKPNIPADPELAYLTCGGCGTHSVFAAALGKEVASQLHCTACGSSLGYQSASDDMVDDTLDLDDMDVLDLDDDVVDDSPEVVSAEDEEEKADALGVDVTDDSGTKATDKATPGDEAGPSTGKPPEQTTVDTPTSQGNEKPVSAPGSNLNGDAPQVPAALAAMDMMDTIDAKDPLTFAYLGEKVAILSGLKIVATLDKTDAGDNASMMQTAAFREAVGHTIAKNGLKEAAKHYGFKSVVVPVPVQAMIDKAVEAKTSEKTAKVEAALTETATQFQHATDIAAAGFAANFWRNKHDPVKAALIQELSSLGIANAQKVVDRVFEAHGVAQLREVIARARELSNMPVEALNGLAAAINLAKYQPAVVKASEGEDDAEEESSDEEDQDDESESMVTTLATAEVEASDDKVTASVFKPKSKELARILQGQALFN